jgi:Major Facilitator Superfamily
LHGATAGIIGPAIAAISLGLAGRHGMSLRIGRNYRFAALGNALTAATTGLLGTYVSNHAIFLASAALCVPTLIALGCIKANEIDYARARNAAKTDGTFRPQRIADLGKNRNLFVFAFCLVMFHFSNASLLPLITQNLGQSKSASGPLFVAGLVIVPQIVFALLAPWVGYWSELWGRKPLLLAGFGSEALRACLYSVVSDPTWMLAVQLLDGITASLITVLTVLVVTDLTVGTGRFNLAQGVIGMFTGLSATFSTPIIGTVVQHFGDLAGFLIMAAAGFSGMAVLWALFPEGRPQQFRKAGVSQAFQ